MRVYSVSEFRSEVNELLEEVTVVIEGEITEFHVSQNRFVWFSLADDQTILKCFMLTFQLRIAVEDGMQVRVVGSPTLFKKGQFVFRPRTIELVGEGSLKQSYELLKKKLEAEGLFDASRKRSVPRFPRRIGLLTSRDAAAYTDVLRILNNRWRGVEIVHLNIQVQGTGAVNSIVAGLQQLCADEPNLDCILLTRGGGSLEDLQAFNTEDVVRAIFACSIPVVSAVGHERDVTLADLVADVRASTPSNAAEMIVPHRDDVLNEINHMLHRCERQVETRIHDQKNRIADMVSVLDRNARRHSMAFQAVYQRLQFALQEYGARLQSQRERVEHLVSVLHVLNPTNILDRGYTMTMDEHGKVITSHKSIRRGQRLITRFSAGSVESTVDRV